ncbi:MAG: thioredoxin family protein, partial [Sinomicrobium sp.]|nr:thioredoxin family protein [Sinomicrobium sp.]
IPVLLGVKKRSDLEAAPYNTWFTANYEAYETDQDVIRQLKPLLKGITITIFMGTWCGDSKEQTPHFYKILDAAGYNEKKLTLITVSRNKTTPEQHEAGRNIIRVPTIIFYKNGSELNRIVEYPIESLEKDMLAILSGAPYKHAYAN